MMVKPDIPRPVIGIHQPNFLPWAGFFHKMKCCDLFIYLDTAAFTKNSFQNRNQIRTPSGPSWLTVPVLTKGQFGKATSEIEINNTVPWRRKHLGLLDQSYRKSRFVTDYFPSLKELYSGTEKKLVDFNIPLLSQIKQWLKIITPTRTASELNVTGTATERLISLVKSVDGKTYLSGTGGRKYLDEGLFQKEGIKLIYQEYKIPIRDQQDKNFVSGLSVIDDIFNYGPETGELIFGGNNGF